MTQKMVVRRSLLLAGCLALAGCAQQGASRPTYIGLSDLADDNLQTPAEAGPAGLPSAALRHIQSNKVLGAMAFQKVTGRTVDPDSLSGRE